MHHHALHIALCLGGIAAALAAVALGYVTLAPILLLAGCVLMMVLMMRGMHGGDGRDEHGH